MLLPVSVRRSAFPTIAVLSCLVLIAPLAARAVAGGNTPDSELLARATLQYCKDYTDETVQFLLTQGPPPDVEMMEEAQHFLKDGQWTINGETVNAEPGVAPGIWRVTARCIWKSPVEDLNGPFELDYRLELDRSGTAIKSVSDAPAR